MWFLRDLGRLNLERQFIEALQSSSCWLDGVRWYFDGPRLAIDADIVLDESRCFPVTLRFPDHYPSAPASVRPRKAELWSDHQYGSGGDLCLELGPDNWHPESHNAALLLESTFRLLSLEVDHAADDTIDIPSRHALTEGQDLRSKFLRWVVTPGLLKALDSLPVGPSYRCDVVTLYRENAMTVAVQRIERLGYEEDWLDPTFPKELRHLGRRARGVIVTRPIGILTQARIDVPEVVASLIEDPQVPDSHEEGANNELSVVEYVFHKGLDGAWQGQCRWDDGRKVWPCSRLDVDTTSGEERHGLDAARLQDLTVAVVGLGSAGSKIATSLARSGVGRFVLVDDDLLHPSNLVRHDGDVSGVGQHKVDAVGDRLVLINPKIEIIRRRHRLQGQESSSSAASALSAIGNADLIIDATANPAVFSLCAHVARHSKTPLLWLEVFAGGIGGLIARSRPDFDAEPFTLRAAIHQAANDLAEQKGVEPPEGAARYGAEVEDTIVIASDADVSVLAAHATQVGLDTLQESEPSRYRYPAYLVGMARGWVFEEAFHTIPIRCSAPVNWSTTVETDKATREDASVFIGRLLEDLSADADAETSP